MYIKIMTMIGVLRVSSMNVTLHTEPSVSPPEFSIICHTEGGPVTYVTWAVPGGIFTGSHNGSTQIIVDTSHNSVYENRLRVRGRKIGTYTCNINNNRQDFFVHEASNVQGHAQIIGMWIVHIHTLNGQFLIFQLLESPPVSMPYLSPTVHMSILL